MTQKTFARAAGLGALLFAVASRSHDQMDSLVQMLQTYRTHCSADATTGQRRGHQWSSTDRDANALRSR